MQYIITPNKKGVMNMWDSWLWLSDEEDGE